jgi:hypothetical protein
MRKLTVVSLAMVLLLLGGASLTPSSAQTPTKDDTPTFYRLVPGTYVNGWPRFTITYPKEWVERRPDPQMTFHTSAPGPVPFPTLIIAPFPTYLLPGSALPSLEVFAESLSKALSGFATDVAVVSDKPSRLSDGSLAREVELKMVLNGAPLNVMGLVAKKGDRWINTAVRSRNGRIGPDLRAILHSIKFEPDKDAPMKPPPDVQEFLDKMHSDLVSHDVTKVMGHYSDRFLNSGNRKGDIERILRLAIDRFTSFDIVITDVVPAGDRTYLTGFISTNLGKLAITETSTIKENGGWKWYGNQRNPAP